MCDSGCGLLARRAQLGAAHQASTILLALMPRLGCPLCWPVLAALLGAFGLHVTALNGVLSIIAAAALLFSCIGVVRGSANRLQFAGLAIASALMLGFRVALLPPLAGYAAAGIVLCSFSVRNGSSFFQRLFGPRSKKLGRAGAETQIDSLGVIQL